MTSIKKHFLLLFIALFSIFTLVFGTAFLKFNSNALVETDNVNAGKVDGKKYFYNNLTTTDSKGDRVEYTLAKKFYKILDNLNDAGDFIKGKVSYELSDVISSAQIKSWVRDGNLEIPKAFSAARDSFLMDHPELFYIDMYKLTISAGYSNGVYSAYIDTGREANVYRDKTFKTESEVQNAIINFNNKVEEIAEKATQSANLDESSQGFDLKLAKAVNEEIANNVEYDFGTLNDAINGQNVLISNMTFSSYGALVYNKAVCAGYSSAYKVIMDYLDIPCVMVSGYSKGKDDSGNNTGNNVGHSWNYVWLETAEKETADQQRNSKSVEEKVGEWFAFDTTWNSLSANKNKYSALDSISEAREHIPDGVVSSSGYELTYPALSSISYNEANNPEILDREIESFGLSYKSEHIYNIDLDAYNVYEYLSYNGKNSSELLSQDGMRMIARSQYMKDGEIKWTKWQDVYNSTLYENSGFEDKEGCTSIYVNQNISHSQYAIIKDLEPDTDSIITGNIYYSDDDLVEEHLVIKSQLFVNQAYGTYTAPPYIVNSKTYPNVGAGVIINDNMAGSSSSAIVSDKNAIPFKIVYDEPLHILDKTKPIGIDYKSDHENTRQYAIFVPFSDGKYVHLTADENGVMNTLEFKFKPSLMYEHNMESYIFMFNNVGSAKIVDKKINGDFVRTTSDKAPNYAYYSFSRFYMACPLVFGDGRLWVDCCAQPVLVDNSDLSENNFKDEENNNTFNDTLRSQMMLVVDKVSKEVENSMLNEIEDADSINIDKKDIKSSQTFDINLQICGKYKKIPDGSYVKIALGFPEGYGPKDEGVTFKLFHRKHLGGDEYQIEEVPCVVTKFGIVATVTSFSPYMVAVVPTNKVEDKSIYASIDGKGGKLTMEDGKIRQIEEGGSYTYTINPDEGYKLYNVSLNGENITDRVVDGKLEISYDDLKFNNELTIQYIAEEAAERFEANNIVDTVKVVVSTEGKVEIYDYDTDGLPVSNSNVKIIMIVSIVAAVIVVAGVSVLLIKKKKSARQ